MITRIHDAAFYPFAHTLQEKLNETYGDFLDRCRVFFKEQREVSNNFATFIRSTDPLYPSRNQHYFIIELDDRTLLDLTGDYDPKTNTIRNATLRATLPYHETWYSEHFHSFSLTENERQSFLRRQENFWQFCQSIDLGVTIDILEFNPDRDSLPESVIVIEPNKGTMDDLLKDDAFFSFLHVYYQYCLETNRLFEHITDNTQRKKA